MSPLERKASDPGSPDQAASNTSTESSVTHNETITYGTGAPEDTIEEMVHVPESPKGITAMSTEEIEAAQTKYFEEFKARQAGNTDQTRVVELKAELTSPAESISTPVPTPEAPTNLTEQIALKRVELREAVMKPGNIENKVRLNNELNALLKAEADNVSNSEKMQNISKARALLDTATDLPSLYNIIRDMDSVLIEQKSTNADAIKAIVEDITATKNFKDLDKVTRFLGLRRKITTLIMGDVANQIQKNAEDILDTRAKLESLVKDFKSDPGEKANVNNELNALLSTTTSLSAEMSTLKSIYGDSAEVALNTPQTTNVVTPEAKEKNKASVTSAQSNTSGGLGGGGMSTKKSSTAQPQKEGFFAKIGKWFTS
jgi:hypothetical protein